MSDFSLILQLVVRKGLVSKEQLRIIEESRERIDEEAQFEELVRKGFLERKTVFKLLADEFSLRFVDFNELDLPKEPSEYLQETVARQFRVFPLEFQDESLLVAISNPLDVESIDSLSHMLKTPIEPVLADGKQIEEAINTRYDRNALESLDSEEESDIAVRSAGVTMEMEDVGADESDAPIIRLVQVIIAEAIRQRASDIHLEPMDTRFRVRYRVDGELQEMSSPPPKRLQLPVISRIKVMGKLSIAEKRLPQDGRIQVRVEGVDYDLRVSSLPTAYGESIVMRILDKTGLMKGLPELGFLSDDQENFEQLITLPDGILLVTGPTGSGKTTTLYSCLNYVNKPDRKIITVEDPIEYYHDHNKCIITQREVGVDVPSFSEAIRRALRQDPDVILVGEMRDLETIEAAISAAETGHLVFGTLHTNSAAKTVDRIVDAFPANMKEMIRTQLATSLVSVVSQVLCKKEGGGRVAGLEIMVTTTSIAALIRDNKTYRIDSDIQTGAKLGMFTMDTHLMSLYNRGLISAREAFEKAQSPEEMRKRLEDLGGKVSAS